MHSTPKLSKYITFSPFTFLSFSMSCYWFILIKIYYICPIFCFRKAISWINIIKSSFILIIPFCFKIIQRIRQHYKSCIFVPTRAKSLTVSVPARMTPSPAQITSSPTRITPLLNNIFSDILVPKQAKKIPKNPPICFFTFNCLSSTLIKQSLQEI